MKGKELSGKTDNKECKIEWKKWKMSEGKWNIEEEGQKQKRSS